MSQLLLQEFLRCAAAATFLFALGCPLAVPAIKNMAVVVSAGSKLADGPLAGLVKYCKGAAKAGPDGKNFVIVFKNPDSPEMRVALQELFGSFTDVKVTIRK